MDNLLISGFQVRVLGGSPLSPGNSDSFHVGIFRIGKEKVLLKLDDSQWNVPKISAELLATQPWVDLKSILSEFHQLSIENSIEPLIVYIPTANQVYGRCFTGEGGRVVKDNIQSQLRFESNAADALGNLTDQLKIRYVNLSPVFRCAAVGGQFLHYQFDNHWNGEGREVAVEYVGAYIKGAPKVLAKFECAPQAAPPRENE